MDMETKIRLLKVMYYEAWNECERAVSENRDADFHNGYRSALGNVLDVLNGGYFAQIMIDYYTGKGE